MSGCISVSVARLAEWPLGGTRTRRTRALTTMRTRIRILTSLIRVRASLSSSCSLYSFLSFSLVLLPFPLAFVCFPRPPSLRVYPYTHPLPLLHLTHPAPLLYVLRPAPLLSATHLAPPPHLPLPLAPPAPYTPDPILTAHPADGDWSGQYIDVTRMPAHSSDKGTNWPRPM